MSVIRKLFLAASESAWLREQAPKFSFVRRTVERFMPGETIEDALRAIETQEQLRLAEAGWRVRTLISNGRYWYPWFMRRIAERPANAWFVLQNLIAS